MFAVATAVLVVSYNWRKHIIIQPSCDSEARVACRPLGFKGVSRFYSSGSKGVSGLAIVAANLGCSGSEHAIRDCKGTFNSQGLTQCNHEDDVGLICASDDSQAIDTRVRIQNGGPAGRLEMYVMEQTPKYGLHGQWGTVCNDGFDTAAAMVACREMGFAAGLNCAISVIENISALLCL